MYLGPGRDSLALFPRRLELAISLAFFYLGLFVLYVIYFIQINDKKDRLLLKQKKK